jgi:hypothetical protein
MDTRLQDDRLNELQLAAGETRRPIFGADPAAAMKEPEPTTAKLGPHRVHFQDFRNYVPFTGQKRPTVQTFDFPSLEEARAFRAGLPIDDQCVATITPVPAPKVRKQHGRKKP